MTENKKKLIENLYIIIAIFIAIIIVSNVILNYNITGTDDGYLHLIKVIGVNEIIKTGQFPPIINQGFCHGYAINLFYNPLTTYISLVCGLIVNNFAMRNKINVYNNACFSKYIYVYVHEGSYR